jgi:hypothetical protein
MLADV